MKNAFRLGYNRYFDDKQFEENLAFVKENIDVIDELTLFVEYSHHGYWELSQQKEVARVLKDRMEKYRAAGVKSVGINVLATIGHLDESYDVLPKPPFQTMVGDDGQVSKSCLCINNAEYLAYIEERYKILAESAPDFIWIDDDFRIVWHGVTNPCFCSKCLADFSASAGNGAERIDFHFVFALRDCRCKTRQRFGLYRFHDARGNVSSVFIRNDFSRRARKGNPYYRNIDHDFFALAFRCSGMETKKSEQR